MGSLVPFKKYLSDSWNHFQSTQVDDNRLDVCNWYFDRVKVLLDIVKHDLQLIAKHGVLSPLDERFVCDAFYRARGVCSTLGVAYQFRSSETYHVKDKSHVILREIHYKFLCELGNDWSNGSIFSRTYPIDVVPGMAAVLQYDKFVFVNEKGLHWKPTSTYAAARIALIDQVIAKIDSMRSDCSWDGSYGKRKE